VGDQPPAPLLLQSLRKVYRVPVREAGVGAALRSMFARETKDIVAVDDVSFAVQAGEVVGFLGPNGAGKTTTLKMAAGLLHPSGGSVRVLGYEPWRRQKAFLSQITLVMGNRNQLEWDIPCHDSYDLLAAVYRVPPAQYRQTLGELTELLELGPLLSKPVRNLSLGERMKCEVAGALLHRPKVLFLDEPTIGLDVTMQRRIRSFLKEYNQRTGATVLLTSHYMADVEALCKRVVVIHHGRLLYDGGLSGLVEQFSAYKTITIDLANGAGDIPPAGLGAYGETIEQDGGRVKLRVRKADTAAVTSRLLADLPIVDLTVEDPPIEEVIEKVFASEALAGQAAG
jgi:ABC-2 type transport system ATP-binding protein